MRFVFSLIAAVAVSATAHSLTLDPGKFSGVLTEDVVVTECDNDGFHCNHQLKTLASTTLAETSSVKVAESTSVELSRTSTTRSVAGATLFDIAAAKLDLDLSKVPQDVKFGALVQGTLSVLVVDGDARGASYRKYNSSCTVISSKSLSCKSTNINGTGNQLNLKLEVR